MNNKFKSIMALTLSLVLLFSVSSVVSAKGETATIGNISVEKSYSKKLEIPYFLSGVDNSYQVYTGIDITILFDNTKLNFEGIKKGKIKNTKNEPLDFIYTDCDIANKNGFIKLSYAGIYDKDGKRTEGLTKDSVKSGRDPLFYLLFTKNSDFKSGESVLTLKENFLYPAEYDGKNKINYDVKNGVVKVVKDVPKGGKPSGSGSIKVRPVAPTLNNIGASRFIDLSGVKWASEDIDYITKREIMVGTSYNTFEPNAGIKRGDIALMTDRLFDFDPIYTKDFIDIPEDMYYRNAILKLTSLGIAKGYDNNHYMPEKTVSRQEMVAFCYRALEVSDMLPKNVDVEKELSIFKDKENLEDYAKKPMATFISLGIIKGRSDNMLAPDDYITRAEAASIFTRLSKYIENIKY